MHSAEAETFIERLGEVYEEMKRKMVKYCQLIQLQFDEDVFNETILKCYETIMKQGLEDTSDKGCQNYFFKSLIQNLRRERLYARNLKRDIIPDENINDILEQYLTSQPTAQDKILSDCYKDFAVYYIMCRAMENFSDEQFHLFNLKTLGNYTYKQLQQLRPSEKNIRQKVAEVKRWIVENVSKEEVDKAFWQFFE